ncbi:MAG: RNA polymerase sigma factor [Fimbriimonas sp.]
MVATAMLDWLWRPPSVTIDDLIRNHYDEVYRFCARRAEESAAADLTQATFIDAQKSLRSFRGDSSAKTWLFGIAYNRCRQWAKQRKQEGPQVELREDLLAVANSESQLVDREILQQALAKLTPDHREAVWLCVVEGLTTAEAGAVAGVPQGTIKSRLHYAFAQLRKQLTEEEVTR